MDDPGWDKIVDAIDARFGLVDHGQIARPLEDRPDLHEQVAYIVFKRDQQQYKLERVSRPAVVDRKSYYHKAARGGIRHENVYDAESLTHKTVVFRHDGQDWVEIDPAELGM